MNKTITAQLEQIRGALVEADEVDLQDLPPSYEKYAEEIERTLRAKFSMAWRGIHGTILEFDLPAGTTGGANTRLTKEDLKVLMGFKSFRWVETRDSNSVSVGC